MSDNFFRIARKEIQEELDGLHKILLLCNNDADISSNGNSIEKHLHKIKGLAPMMGQNEVGEIAKMTDTILKHIITNGMLAGAYQILVESNYVMKEIFNGTSALNVSEFKNKLRQNFPDLLGH
ncbi:MAG: hypothetical protein ACREAK_06265 [Nitrosarchaeum sp.]